MVSASLLAIMTLFPPWIYTATYQSIYREKSAGYSFIVSPPQPESPRAVFGVKLDVARLSVQILGLLALTGIGLIFVSRPGGDEKKTTATSVHRSVPKNDQEHRFVSGVQVAAHVDSPKAFLEERSTRNTRVHSLLFAKMDSWDIFPIGMGGWLAEELAKNVTNDPLILVCVMTLALLVGVAVTTAVLQFGRAVVERKVNSVRWQKAVKIGINLVVILSFGIPALVAHDRNDRALWQQKSAAAVTPTEIERLKKEFVVQSAAVQKEYLSEVDASGFDTILDPHRLKDDRTLSKSKALIERARALDDKYEKKFALLLLDWRARVSTLSGSDGTKKQILAEFDEGIEKARSQLHERFNLDRQAILQIENIISFLRQSKDWTVEGEQIVFANDEALAKFKSYVEKLQKIAQEQEQLKQTKDYAEAIRILEAEEDSAAKLAH